MFDYHIHTFYSPDGNMTMDEACKKAIGIGLREIVFTDHMDIDLPENKFAFQIDDMDEYIHEIGLMKNKYKKDLIVKTGIEIGIQDWTLDMASSLVNNYKYDFVIASIHYISNQDPYLQEFFESRNKVQAYLDYYRTIHDLVKVYNDFNVLGHLDYLRRYIPYAWGKNDYLIGIDIIDAILKILIQKGKGLELNTSGYKHHSGQPHPHPGILKRFRELGGEIVTIGSDAHSPEYIGYENKRALELLKYAGFSYVTTFTSMEPKFIKIDTLCNNL